MQRGDVGAGHPSAEVTYRNGTARNRALPGWLRYYVVLLTLGDLESLADTTVLLLLLFVFVSVIAVLVLLATASSTITSTRRALSHRLARRPAAR